MILVKVGGGENLNKQNIAQDLARLAKQEEFIFVHGANKQRDALAEQLGKPVERITSPSGMVSVHTDETAIEILSMAYAGLVNTQWVQALQAVGLNAIGISGVDGRTWEAKRKKHVIKVDENGKQLLITNTFTGRVVNINTELLNLLVQNNYVPVLTQPAISLDNQLVNTDNDLNVAVMAEKLKAKTIVMLFEAPGFLRDAHDPTSVIKTISKDELPELLPLAHGTMKKKILGALQALEAGVETLYWSDSRVENPIQAALAGQGTTIK